MNKLLVSDELWEVIASLLPPERPKPWDERLHLADRKVFTWIVFVLI